MVLKNKERTLWCNNIDTSVKVAKKDKTSKLCKICTNDTKWYNICKNFEMSKKYLLACVFIPPHGRQNDMRVGDSFLIGQLRGNDVFSISQFSAVAFNYTPHCFFLGNYRNPNLVSELMPTRLCVMCKMMVFVIFLVKELFLLSKFYSLK